MLTNERLAGKGILLGLWKACVLQACVLLACVFLAGYQKPDATFEHMAESVGDDFSGGKIYLDLDFMWNNQNIRHASNFDIRSRSKCW